MSDIMDWLDKAREICYSEAQVQNTIKQGEDLCLAASLITSARIKLVEIYGAP